MTQEEFEERVGLKVNKYVYEQEIEKAYSEGAETDKDVFCRNWLEARPGVKDWPKAGDRVRIKGWGNIKEYDGKTGTVHSSFVNHGVSVIVNDPPSNEVSNPWWLNIDYPYVTRTLTKIAE